MIASLKGSLIAKNPTHAVVEAGGVGYQIALTLNTFYELPPEGAEVFFHVHTYMKEDHWALYGFLTAEEKRLFEQLLKVNGVGPRMGLNILSGLNPGEVIEAVNRGQAVTLRKISGVGQKLAEKIILDLKGKLGEAPAGSARPQASQTFDEALSALVRLGYTHTLAEGALSRLDWTGGLDLKQAITQGLKQLGK